MSSIKMLRVLKADNNLALLVGNRISLAPAKQDQKLPLITYEFQFDDPVTDLQGTASLQRQEWRISVISDKFINAEQVKEAILATMQQEKIEFRASFQDSEYENDLEADTHRFSLDFLITYQL